MNWKERNEKRAVVFLEVALPFPRFYFRCSYFNSTIPLEPFIFNSEDDLLYFWMSRLTMIYLLSKSPIFIIFKLRPLTMIFNISPFYRGCCYLSIYDSHPPLPNKAVIRKKNHSKISLHCPLSFFCLFHGTSDTATVPKRAILYMTTVLSRQNVSNPWLKWRYSNCDVHWPRCVHEKGHCSTECRRSSYCLELDLISRNTNLLYYKINNYQITTTEK